MSSIMGAVVAVVVTALLYVTGALTGWALLGVFLGVWFVAWIVIRLFGGSDLVDILGDFILVVIVMAIVDAAS